MDFHVAMRATPDGMPADDPGRVAGYDAQFAAVAARAEELRAPRLSRQPDPE